MTILLKKVQSEIIVALALIILGAGIEHSISNESTQVVIDSDYNAFTDKAGEVNSLMQDTLNGKVSLEVAQDKILYEYAPWAERQENSQEFLAYLEACNQVIIQMSKGFTPDISEMEKLKKEFIPS